MAHADLVGEDIAIWTEFRERDLIKMVPGAKWNATERYWHAPAAWSTCKVLRGVFGEQLTVGEALATWAWETVNNVINPSLELRIALEAEYDQDMGDKLFPFQRAGAQWMALVERGLLADEMGSGKTIQTIMALRLLVARYGWDAVFPACFIVPNSMKRTWVKEFAKWFPSAKCVSVEGGAVGRRKQLAPGSDVYIVNWEAVRLHSRLAPYGSIRLSDEEKRAKELNRMGFKTVVADEAHKLKNPQAKQSRAVWAVGHGADVRFRYALTGTPLANTPDDLWSILHFVDPNEWSSKTRYVDRYCLVSWNAWGGMDVIGVQPTTREEFFAILDPRMRRMPKELVLPFLPPKLRSIRYVKMGTKQAKAYGEMENSMLTQTEEGDLIMATNTLTRNTRLIQFSSSYAEVDAANNVRLSEPSSKLDEMMSILDELGPDEAVVIAAESRQLIELAATRLDNAQTEASKHFKSPTQFTYRKIVGGMTPEERERHKEDFQEGRARVMLMTIKAGGVGLTLTRAGVIVFLQRSWSMLDNKQAEDRVHRIGSEQHDKILVIDLVAPDTVEEGQIDSLYAKFERLQEIVRDKELMRLLGDTAKLAELEAEEDRIIGSDLT